MIMNGFVRSTLDADLLVEASPANLENLLATLGNVGEGWARELTLADFELREGSIRIAEHFDIDLFVQIKGLRYEDFASEARSVQLQDREILFLNPEQIIRLKADSRREKDQLDVIAMRNLLQEKRAEQSKPSLGRFGTLLRGAWALLRGVR